MSPRHAEHESFPYTATLWPFLAALASLESKCQDAVKMLSGCCHSTVKSAPQHEVMAHSKLSRGICARWAGGYHVVIPSLVDELDRARCANTTSLDQSVPTLRWSFFSFSSLPSTTEQKVVSSGQKARA